jgi:predicted dehydrogenase
MAEKDAVEVGVIGCGAIAQLVHLPILSEMTGVKLVAICDDNRTKAELVADRHGSPAVYSSAADFLEHEGLDAVVVCTPNHLHAEQTELALQAGTDVLCERPLGTSREQVARTLAVAKQSGRNLMVANNHRFRPDAWALRRFIQAGELGEIFHVHSSWQRRLARRPRVSEWRRSQERGGGVVMDLGVTNLDACLWMLDYPAPERLTAYLLDRDDDGVDDSAVILMRLEGNVTCNDRHTLAAMGATGFGSLSPFMVQKETGGKIVDVTPRLAPGTENVFRASYRRELEYFMRVIQGVREEPLPEEQEVLLGIVDACYRSTEEGREIVL